MSYEVKQTPLELPTAAIIPAYLVETYWWAYIHPNAVSLFERQWLVNLILWGNFSRLRDAALAELGQNIPGKTLQVACVYGDFSTRLVDRIAPRGWLDIVDVLPIQLSNLHKKLAPGARADTFLRNSADLGFADASYDQAILFFLLHEQPEAVRRQTLSEALRVVKPGGKTGYHRLPSAASPASAALSVPPCPRLARTVRSRFVESRRGHLAARTRACRSDHQENLLWQPVPEAGDQRITPPPAQRFG